MSREGDGREKEGQQRGQDQDLYYRELPCLPVLHSLFPWLADPIPLLRRPLLPSFSQIQPSDYLTFTSSYSQILKSSMTTLRKKKKTKPLPKSLVGTAPGGAGTSTFPLTLTKVVGPRRGKGHSKRQRSEKARERQVAKLLARRKKEKGSGMGTTTV